MKHVFFALAAMVSLIIASCSMVKQQSNQPSAAAILGKEWQLTTLNGEAVAASINGKTPFIQLDSASNRFSANAGCNGLGGEYTVGKNKALKFARGMSTLMACENMETEQAFAGILSKVASYTDEADTFTLLDAQKNPLATFKLMQGKNAQASLDGSWTLDYISGPRIAFNGLYPNAKPVLTFDTANAKVSGNSSCNGFNGKITIDGSQLKFGPLASTKMACPGEGEFVFLQTLDKINSFSVHEDTLTLIMGDIAMMRFVRNK